MKTCRPFDRMIVPALPTLDVGGQNGTDSTGPLLDGLQAQTEQAMRTFSPFSLRPGLTPSMLPNGRSISTPESTRGQHTQRPA